MSNSRTNTATTRRVKTNLYELRVTLAIAFARTRFAFAGRGSVILLPAGHSLSCFLSKTDGRSFGPVRDFTRRFRAKLATNRWKYSFRGGRRRTRTSRKDEGVRERGEERRGEEWRGEERPRGSCQDGKVGALARVASSCLLMSRTSVYRFVVSLSFLAR